MAQQAGRVEWIGISKETRASIESVTEAVVQVGTGIVGEHHAATGKGDRQVTLIQQEHIPVMASMLGQDSIHPGQLRRNVLVSGINLLALMKKRFFVGDILLEGTGPCDPCSRMLENLGPSGIDVMTGHGGITATVIEGGTIRVGDSLSPVAGSGNGE
jgi:MOSC domain-containing protein YiiM